MKKQPTIKRAQINPGAETFDVSKILDGIRDGFWLEMHGTGDQLGALAGDRLLVDPYALPRVGDLVAWKKRNGALVIGKYVPTDADYYAGLAGVVSCLVRRFRCRERSTAKPRRQRSTAQKTVNKPTIRRTSQPRGNVTKIRKLREQLDALERVPENEGEHFRLLTEIHNLENASTASVEWPDVIETKDDRDSPRARYIGSTDNGTQYGYQPEIER